MVHYRIYIASPSKSILNLRQGLHRALEAAEHDGEVEIEVINVLESPERAVADNVMVTPTIIRKRPEPETRVTGNLNDMAAVVAHLGLS